MEGWGGFCSHSSTSGAKQRWDSGAWDLGVSGFWVSPPSSMRMSSSGARAACGGQTLPEGLNTFGGTTGERRSHSPHAPSSVWAWGRGMGRKFPICSAPILASPFVSLAICPTAPHAPRSRCTCHKYQDGLCLCFKRQRGPRAPALPWPPALPNSGCCQP